MNSDHGIMTPQFIYDRYEQWSWMINDHNWSYDHWSWMINDHNWSYDHWSYMIGVHRCSYERWSSMINDHTDSCMNVLFMLWKAIDHSYDILIIAMNRVLIMHDSIHNHVIMNIIVNPTWWTISKCFAATPFDQHQDWRWSEWLGWHILP